MEKYFPARKINSFIFKLTRVSRASCIYRDAIFFVGKILNSPSVLGFGLVMKFVAVLECRFSFLFCLEGFIFRITKTLYVVFALVS